MSLPSKRQKIRILNNVNLLLGETGMRQIINFFITNRNFLLFLLLFTISVFFTIQTHNYHSDKFLSSANAVTGNIYQVKSNISAYFLLGKENQKLLEENLKLRNELEYFRELTIVSPMDSTVFPQFDYSTATIINNNFNHTKNYLTINKGSRHGLETDMGVISDKGLVGIISRVSKNFSTVQSILNTNSRTNAKLSNSGHFGTLIWDTKDPNVVQLIDIPRLAELKIGDSIITGGKSVIFPEGIPIGSIIKYRPDSKDDNYYVVDVALFNDMTSLEYVYLIENKFVDEITELENEAGDVE